MDPYLRAIGFSRKTSLMKSLCESVKKSPDKRVVSGLGQGETTAEFYKMFGENIGVIIRGVLDEKEEFASIRPEAFAISDYYTVVNHFLVEQCMGSPVIVFEDEHSGNELVFSLQNKLAYYRNPKRFIDHGRSVNYVKNLGIVKRRVNFAALSLGGTVILPVAKFEGPPTEEENYFQSLVTQFNESDSDEALELLLDYAERASSIIRQRLKDEDFLSVVEGYLMPASEIDVEYSVLGAINGVSLDRNTITGESIYKLDISVTGARVQLFINKKDILGLPAPGMRFMGTCKLTGSVQYEL